MEKYRSAFGFFVVSVTLFLMLLAITEPAQAFRGEQKSLRGRLGVGFTNQVAVTSDRTIPALSAKYYLHRGMAMSLATGFDTRSDGSTLGLGLKLFKNVFHESNLIFYFGGGLAYVNHAGSKMQGSLFLGSEFFLAQLPSLGLSFEAGLRGDSTTGSFAIRTTGDSFITAGMHFYF
jgi:hypothetical protein